MIFIAGLVCGMMLYLLICHLSNISFSRRHKVVMALLKRAGMYQERAKMLTAAGDDVGAVNVLKECHTLIEQADVLHRQNGGKGLL